MGEDDISIYDKGEGEVHAAMHILQKFVARLGKVTTSHEEQTSPMKDFGVFLDMSRCKNWVHKIFS